MPDRLSCWQVGLKEVGMTSGLRLQEIMGPKTVPNRSNGRGCERLRIQGGAVWIYFVTPLVATWTPTVCTILVQKEPKRLLFCMLLGLHGNVARDRAAAGVLGHPTRGGLADEAPAGFGRLGPGEHRGSALASGAGKLGWPFFWVFSEPELYCFWGCVRVPDCWKLSHLPVGGLRLAISRLVL